MNNKKIDLIILLIYPIIGAVISHLFNANAFFSVIIFFGLPSLYLTIKGKEYSKKAITFSLISGIPAIIIIDYVSHLTGQWIIPNSILKFRLLEFVSLEVIAWAVLNFYFVVMFYEYFLHHHITKKVWRKGIKHLTLLSLASLIIFLTVYWTKPNLLNMSYYYLWSGLGLFIIPLIFQFVNYPKFISKFFQTAAYFFYLTLTYEITALQLGWWGFPGKFIGWVSIWDIQFPIEELIFWICLFAMAILTYYEYFEENEK